MRSWIGSVVVGLVLVAGGAAVQAQQQDDFVPVEPGTALVETLPAAPMVMTAYALAWLLIIGYVWSLRRRQARVALELESLRARVKPGPSPSQP